MSDGEQSIKICLKEKLYLFGKKIIFVWQEHYICLARNLYFYRKYPTQTSKYLQGREENLSLGDVRGWTDSCETVKLTLPDSVLPEFVGQKIVFV